MIENRALQLDDMLDRMARAIQLDKTRYDRMVTAFEAVQKWISDDPIFFKPYLYEVYAHGSVRVLTAIKPLSGEEFDLDVVIHMKTWPQHSPKEIVTHLKRRLEEHEKYKNMLILKSRVIRLEYSGDFHMDLLIGLQEHSHDENRLKVPDRELGIWVSSNPRGYASWFFNKANMVTESLLEKALRAENLPIDDFENKKPLQRAVQLIKRYRDEFFRDDQEFKTSSIILTTICGYQYAGEDSIYGAIEGIITKLRLQYRDSLARIKVSNPVNAEEDFTDKWENEPGYYEAFKNFVEHLYDQWQKLKAEQGIIEESKILKSLFGEMPYSTAFTQQALMLEELRRKELLRHDVVNKYLTNDQTKTTIPLAPNTFYGT